MTDQQRKLKWKAQAKAHGIVNWAIQSGKLSRPDTCELCGDIPGISYFRGNDNSMVPRTKIVAHHWNGYDDPFKIWFICVSCNMILRGRHDGSLTKMQARLLVARHRNRRSVSLTPKLEEALRRYDGKYNTWKVNLLARFCNQV